MIHNQALSWYFCLQLTALFIFIPSVSIYAEQDSSEWTLLIEQASQLAEKGFWNDATDFAKKALDLAENEYGSDHLNTAKSLDFLGLLYYRQRLFFDAELYYSRSLGIKKSTLGTAHPEYAKSLDHLALVYLQTFRLRDAESLFKQSLQIYKNTIGTDNSEYVKTLLDLAILNHEQQYYKEAKSQYSQVLEILEKPGFQDTTLLKSTRQHLAELSTDRNRSPEYKSRFSLVGSGSLLKAKQQLALNYDPSFSFTLGLGVVKTLPRNDNEITNRLHLVFSRDVFELKKSVNQHYEIANDVIASNSGIHIEYCADAFSLNFNKFRLISNVLSAYGINRFSIAEPNFEKFGKTTLTELEAENKKIEFSSYYSLGFSADSHQQFSMNYYYDFINTQKSFIFGHYLIGNLVKSASINGIISGAEHFLHTRIIYSQIYHFIVTCYAMTAILFWENVNQNYVNWPFKDEPVLKYNRHRIGITYYF